MQPLRWLKDIYYSVCSRIIYHPHRLHIHHPELSGWQWRDRDLVMLCANFQILVDFVEKELPYMSRLCGEPSRWHRWMERLPVLSWYVDCCRFPQQGIEHLKWAISLGEESPSQAEYAKEQLDLYLWWTQVRPARIDPFDMVEDRPIGSIQELFADGKTVEAQQIKDAYFESLRKAGAIDDAYDVEDEAQLIRLMKVRTGLWT